MTKRNHETEEGDSDPAPQMVENRLLRHKHFRNFFTGSGPVVSCIYLGGVHAELYAPLAQVVPLGPVATPFPFLVLDLPPPVV